MSTDIAELCARPGKVTLNILVTGGAGFIGRALVERLVKFANVLVLDSLDEQVHLLTEFPGSLSLLARCVRADLREPGAYARELNAIDTVVHLAAQTGTAQSMYELSRYTSHNLGGTAALLETLAERGIRPGRVILASSRAVYGEGVYETHSGFNPATRSVDSLRRGNWEPVDKNGAVVAPLPMRYGQPAQPTSIYGFTKLWQEQLLSSVCSTRGIDCAVLRLQNVFGPGQSISNPYTGIIGHFAQTISADEEVELFEDGQMTRDFIFIDDVVQAIEAVVCHRERLDATFDIGSGEGTSLARVAELIANIMSTSARTRASGHFRKGDVRHAVADIGAFRATFGDLPRTPLHVGLKRYCEWFEAQPPTDSEAHNTALGELRARDLFHSSETVESAPQRELK